jgi:hypothetical protein
MPAKPKQRPLAEQREQLDQVIAAKLPGERTPRPRSKPAATANRTHRSRP